MTSDSNNTMCVYGEWMDGGFGVKIKCRWNQTGYFLEMMNNKEI